MSFREGLKTIVLATELDGQEEGALEYARKLARAYDARMVLAYSVDPVHFAAVDAVPDQVLDGLTDNTRAALDKMAGELLREGIHSHSEIRQTTVAQMLVDVARRHNAGLIVMGAKGSEGAGPVVVGAVAEQLVRMAPCPVLAVAADWNAGPHRPHPGGPVLLAMERNEAAPAAAASAYSLAETFKRPLLVLHVRTAAEASAFLNPCETRLEEFGLRPSGHVPVECIVKDGATVDAIMSAIEMHHPAILVVGVKRTSGAPGPHGTAFTLLARSRVPVLCVPPETKHMPLAQENGVLAKV